MHRIEIGWIEKFTWISLNAQFEARFIWKYHEYNSTSEEVRKYKSGTLRCSMFISIASFKVNLIIWNDDRQTMPFKKSTFNYIINTIYCVAVFLWMEFSKIHLNKSNELNKCGNLKIIFKTSLTRVFIHKLNACSWCCYFNFENLHLLCSNAQINVGGPLFQGHQIQDTQTC